MSLGGRNQGFVSVPSSAVASDAPADRVGYSTVAMLRNASTLELELDWFGSALREARGSIRHRDLLAGIELTKEGKTV